MTVYGLIVRPCDQNGAKIEFVYDPKNLGFPAFTEYPRFNQQHVNSMEYMWYGNNNDDAWGECREGKVKMLKDVDGKDLFPDSVGVHVYHHIASDKYDGETKIGFKDEKEFIKAFIGTNESSPIRGFLEVYSCLEDSWKGGDIPERLGRIALWIRFFQRELNLSNQMAATILSAWIPK